VLRTAAWTNAAGSLVEQAGAQQLPGHLLGQGGTVEEFHLIGLSRTG
jgi:hypothetical protein